MSHRSDSQKTLSDNFMSATDPSFSSSLHGEHSSSTSSPREGRTCLLADLALTTNMAKEFISKFLKGR